MTRKYTTLRYLKMPDLYGLGRPDTLSRGEWEKLARLTATLEQHPPTIPEGTQKTPAGAFLHARKMIEVAIRNALEAEALDVGEWIIQAVHLPERQDPRDLGAWEVRMWCTRIVEPEGEEDHALTIAEKTEEPNNSSLVEPSTPFPEAPPDPPLSLCSTCEGRGEVLSLYPRTGGPPGNRWVPCPQCR